MANKKLDLVLSEEGAGLVASPTRIGRTRSVITHWAKVAGETDGDKIFLMPVRSTDIITGIYRKGAALTGATDVNIGLWTAADVPVDVDENLFADAVSIAAALAIWTQIDAIGVANSGKAIWELLGLTHPNAAVYYLALNLVTGGSAAGAVSIRVDFLI